MSTNVNEINFEVTNNKFWVLETKIPKGKGQASAWVFNQEKSAVLKLRELLAKEDIDFDDPSIMEKIGKKYDLQEIEIGEKSFQIKSVSWFKVALLGFAKK